MSKIESWQDFFDGFYGVNPNAASLTVRITGSTFRYSSYSDTISEFNAAGKKFKLSKGTIKGSFKDSTCSYTGTKKYSDEKKVFDCFVVADKVELYPEDGQKGSYWYTLLASADSANILSLTDAATTQIKNIAIEEVQQEVKTNVD